MPFSLLICKIRNLCGKSEQLGLGQPHGKIFIAGFHHQKIVVLSLNIEHPFFAHFV